MHAVTNRRSRATYESVLLAVYGLADAEGLYCRASDAEIADVVGKGTATVRDHIGRLEETGEVITFGQRDGFHRRLIVILDHPEASRSIAQIIQERRKRDIYASSGGGY